MRGRRTENKKRKKRMQHDDAKTVLLASRGGFPSVQEARRSIKKKEKQKGEQRLQQNEASTGPSVGERERPRRWTQNSLASKGVKKGLLLGQL